jgi:hypothetical protein
LSTKKTTAYSIGNSAPGLVLAQKCVWLSRLLGTQHYGGYPSDNTTFHIKIAYELEVMAKAHIAFCQSQGELLPSLGVCRPLTFHILIFSSETP